MQPPSHLLANLLTTLWPVLATSAIFHFQWVWGDWFTSNIFLTQDRTTLSVLLSTAYIVIPTVTQWRR